MILLMSGDSLRVTTSAAVGLDVVAAYADLAGGAVVPGRAVAAITTATTTSVVGGPASGARRTVRFLSLRNIHATTANTVTVSLHDGATAYQLKSLTLAAGEGVTYDEAAGWQFFNANGLPKQAQSLGVLSPAVNALNILVMATDVTNNNAVANTLQDVTGLGFSVTAGESYWFRALVRYTSAATTTGSRWTVNGPAFSALTYAQYYTLTATTQTIGYQTAYQLPAASNASSLTAGNIADVEGHVTVSASGTLQLQFASEVAGSAIVAKAGSVMQWVRTL